MVTRPIDTQDYISIAEIIVYSFYLVGGIYLCIKHGVSRTAGFRFLVILALARLIGASMLLATLGDATNKRLYIGWAVTNGVGLGPLILMILGLLSRVFDAMDGNGRTVLPPRYGRIVQILMIVAIILVIVGGMRSDYHTNGASITVDYNTISRAGMGLMIVVTVAIVAQLAIATVYLNRIPTGESRILPAVAVALPFVIVRLAYGCLTILGNKHSSIWVYLGTSVLMEFIICLIVEIVGFSLKKLPKHEDPTSQYSDGSRTGKLKANFRGQHGRQ